MKLIDTGYYRSQYTFPKGYVGACYSCGDVIEADEDILTVWSTNVDNMGIFIPAKIYECPHCHKTIPFLAAEIRYDVSKEFQKAIHES